MARCMSYAGVSPISTASGNQPDSIPGWAVRCDTHTIYALFTKQIRPSSRHSLANCSFNAALGMHPERHLLLRFEDHIPLIVLQRPSPVLAQSMAAWLHVSTCCLENFTSVNILPHLKCHWRSADKKVRA